MRIGINGNWEMEQCAQVYLQTLINVMVVIHYNLAYWDIQSITKEPLKHESMLTDKAWLQHFQTNLIQTIVSGFSNVLQILYLYFVYVVYRMEGLIFSFSLH